MVGWYYIHPSMYVEPGEPQGAQGTLGNPRQHNQGRWMTLALWHSGTLQGTTIDTFLFHSPQPQGKKNRWMILIMDVGTLRLSYGRIKNEKAAFVGRKD
jgi:hypothetical protein